MPIRRRSANRSSACRCRPRPGPRSRRRCARRSASARTPRFSSTPPPARPPCHRRRRCARRGGAPTAPPPRGPWVGAVHPRRFGLQHHLHRAPIQAPPAAPTLAAVIPRRLALTAAAAARNPASWPYPRHHQLGARTLLARARCPRSPCACRHPTAHAITSHCARRCSPLRFLTFDKPETLSDNDVRPLRPKSTHGNVRRARFRRHYSQQQLDRISRVRSPVSAPASPTL